MKRCYFSDFIALLWEFARKFVGGFGTQTDTFERAHPATSSRAKSTNLCYQLSQPSHTSITHPHTRTYIHVYEHSVSRCHVSAKCAERILIITSELSNTSDDDPSRTTTTTSGLMLECWVKHICWLLETFSCLSKRNVFNYCIHFLKIWAFNQRCSNVSGNPTLIMTNI